MTGYCDDNWYALQTRPRQERLSSSILAAKGYEVFLPTFTARRVKGGRCFERDKVLFPGYTFCRLVSRAAGKIVTTPGVVRVVGIGGKPTPISKEELRNVQLLNNSELAKEPWKYLPTGCRVCIKTGPLAGLEGLLISAGHERRLVVSIALLQRSVAVTLDHNGVVVPVLPNGACSPEVAARQEQLAVILAGTSF